MTVKVKYKLMYALQLEIRVIIIKYTYRKIIALCHLYKAKSYGSESL